jgi:hypothetical protein
MGKVIEDTEGLAIVAGLGLLAFAVYKLSQISLPSLPKIPTVDEIAKGLNNSLPISGVDWTDVITPYGNSPTAAPGTGWNDGTGNGAPLWDQIKGLFSGDSAGASPSDPYAGGGGDAF